MAHVQQMEVIIINTDLLSEKMKSHDVSKEDLATALGIDRSTIYRKLAKKGDPFTIKEAKQISDLLSLSPKDATLIFFNR